MTKYQTHEAVTRQLCEELSQLQAINAELVASIQKQVQADTSQIMSNGIKPNNSLVQAARQALEALERPRDQNSWYTRACSDADAAKNLREALEHQVQAPVTLLPDGSAFAVMSYPLPKTHWLYAPREYEDGADKPKELPSPILTHAQRDAVVAAVRYAIRGATGLGKDMDFDPDALVQNAVYALCGPYKRAIRKPLP